MTYYLKYLLNTELRFDTILHSTVNWVMKRLMQAISNVNAGRSFPTNLLFMFPSCEPHHQV